MQKNSVLFSFEIRDGIIAVSEVFSYLSRKVPQASDQDQHPVKKGETEGELVIGRVR